MSFTVASNPIDCEIASDPQYYTRLDFEIPGGAILGQRTRHLTHVHLSLSDPGPATAVVSGRFYWAAADGETGRSNYQEESKFYAGGGMTFHNAGDIPAGKFLFFEVRVTTANEEPMIVVHRSAHSMHWAY